MPLPSRIYISGESGTYVLRFQTIANYLPNLAKGFRQGKYGRRAHGSVHFDVSDYTNREVSQTCLRPVLRYLQSVEQSDGASSYLNKWLEERFAESGPTLINQSFSTVGADLTDIFKALGEIFGTRGLGSNDQIFSTMSAFFFTHSETLFKRLPLRKSIEWVLALDGMGKNMTDVLACIVSALQSGLLRATNEEIYRASKPLRRDTRRIFDQMLRGQILNGQRVSDLNDNPWIGNGRRSPPIIRGPRDTINLWDTDTRPPQLVRDPINKSIRLWDTDIPPPQPVHSLGNPIDLWDPNTRPHRPPPTSTSLQRGVNYFGGSLQKLEQFALHHPDRIWVDTRAKRSMWPRTIGGELDWSDDDDDDDDYWPEFDDFIPGLGPFVPGGFVDETGFGLFGSPFEDSDDEFLEIPFHHQHDWSATPPLLLRG